MSSCPVLASTAPIRASVCAGSPRLQVSTCARSPSSPASAVSASARVPLSTTVAPWPCRRRAMAPPIPPDAPVISAVFPVKSNIKASPRRWNLNLALLERGQHGLDFLRRLGPLRGQRPPAAPVAAGHPLAAAQPDPLLAALRRPA